LTKRARAGHFVFLMRCSCCQKEKLSRAFTTLRRIGKSDNGQDLNRFCLRVGFLIPPRISLPQCLETEVVSPTGRFHSQVDPAIISHLQSEIEYLDGAKVYKGKYELEWEKKNQNTLTVSFLGGDTIAMPVTAQTRIKDIKLFLGDSQGMNPRHYRILHGDRELKVFSLSPAPHHTSGETRQWTSLPPV
jgi:hypothetical protein